MHRHNGLVPFIVLIGAFLAALCLFVVSAFAQPYPAPTQSQAPPTQARPEPPPNVTVYLPVVLNGSDTPPPPPTPTPPPANEPVLFFRSLGDVFGGAGVHAVEDGAGGVWVAAVGTSTPQLDPSDPTRFKSRLFYVRWREAGQPTIELTNTLACQSEARPTINSNGVTLVWAVPGECLQTIPQYIPVLATGAQLQEMPDMLDAVPWPFAEDTTP